LQPFTVTLQLADRLLAEQALWLNTGELYGQPGFLRINLATQHARLTEATRRLTQLFSKTL